MKRNWLRTLAGRGAAAALWLCGPAQGRGGALLSEDFERGLSSHWQSLRPNWAVTNGVLKQTQYLANTRYIICYHPGRTWTDYRVEADIWSTDWFFPSKLTMQFHYRDVNNRWEIGLHADGNLYLTKYVGGQYMDVKVQAVGSSIKDRARWAVEVASSEVSVFRDGALVLSARDASLNSGTIGFEAIHIPGFFDNVLVTRRDDGSVLLVK